MVEVAFSERAAKQFWRLPQVVQRRIKQKLKLRTKTLLSQHPPHQPFSRLVALIDE